MHQVIFDQGRFPPPRVKWEGKGAEYCSARAMCLKRGKRKMIQKNWSTFCPDPIPLYIPCVAEWEIKGAD